MYPVSLFFHTAQYFYFFTYVLILKISFLGFLLFFCLTPLPNYFPLTCHSYVRSKSSFHIWLCDKLPKGYNVVSRGGKSLETENRLVVTQSWDRGIIGRLTVVLVSLGCSNKMPQIGWLEQQRHLLLTVLEKGSLRTGNYSF